MINKIKKLREETGAGVMDAKKALASAGGDVAGAKEILKRQGAVLAGKKSERQTSAGIVEAYSHMDKIGAVVEVLCETDFVARNSEFKELAHDLALQVAAYEGNDVEGLLKQEYIKEPSLTVKDLIDGKIAKLGENIRIGRFMRAVLGK